MINFVICCSQGMSSSALMKKMKDYVSEQNLDIDVKASTVDRILSNDVAFDILMLGPQIRFERTKIKNVFPDKIVEIIPMKAYGRLDGAEVIKTGLKLLEDNGK
ncbi:PTS sugar transporter subunit IIB [Breznakia pachnodae]|uniref:PTS system cellobiose-specific IIB component n=1 Tax=Breznakia pachnodae TaxID=265178 RepID=A0ABU0E431_9FIRM|nr:hypothetical protein [Breznakia pachnodae]MDQ0361476.1 PTS system cellobiose-specific IIB component [Breznakia pachnodae]